MLIETLSALPALPEPLCFLYLLWPLPFGKQDVFPAVLNAAEIAPSWFVTRAPSTHLVCWGSQGSSAEQGRDKSAWGSWGDLEDPGKVLAGAMVPAFPLQEPSRIEEEPEGQCCCSHSGWTDRQTSIKASAFCRKGNWVGTSGSRDSFIHHPFGSHRKVSPTLTMKSQLVTPWRKGLELWSWVARGFATIMSRQQGPLVLPPLSPGVIAGSHHLQPLRPGH